MQGMPKPGQTISMDEGARAIAELGIFARQFPLGQPFPVTVTLTDEQWVAVTIALGSIIVHAATEGAPNPFPDWVNPAQREALERIYEANVAGLLMSGIDK